MFAQEKIMTVEHEILNENHETLLRDFESLQKRIKLEEETFDIMKKHLQSRTKELEVTNSRLLEDCVRERCEKEKYEKLFEENKVGNGKSTIDELMKKNRELLLAKRKGEEDLEKIQNKYVELAEKFDVVEAECVYLKSLYDAEVAASGTATPVMSGIGETEHLICHGANKAKNNVTDAILISDESDAEHDNPPRESNISSQRSVDRNQEEQFRNRANSSNENRVLGVIGTPRSVNHPPPLSASSSSSSSSSDGYDVVVQLPPNWPDWAIPKVHRNDSNKS